MKPFVTVIIPTHNRSQLLTQTVDSLLAQTYPADRWELILVDNNSSDDTAGVIAAAVPRHCTPRQGLTGRAARTLRALPAPGSDPGAARDIESRFTTRTGSAIRSRARHLTDYFP